MKSFFFLILMTSLFASAQSKLDVKITEAAKKIQCPWADEANPVTLNAKTVYEKDSVGIIVKVSLAPGWHIYAYVPSTFPYIQIDHILQLPDQLGTVGTWKESESYASLDDPGVLVYENEAVFIHKAVKLSKGGAGVIKTGLYYQTCNLRQCLPPQEKTVELLY